MRYHYDSEGKTTECDFNLHWKLNPNSLGDTFLSRYRTYIDDHSEFKNICLSLTQECKVGIHSLECTTSKECICVFGKVKFLRIFLLEIYPYFDLDYINPDSIIRII